MKNLTSFFVVVFTIAIFSFTNTSQSQVWEKWVARYNGPADSTDIAVSMTADKFGNVYVTGSSFDNETGYDYITIKYNAFGIQEWVRSYNGSTTTAADDKAVAIAVDNSGNVIVTGNSKGEFTTIKYNSSGTQLWVARYDELFTLFPDSVTSLAVDTLGNIYITGSGFGLGTVGSDYQTIKYNSLGEMQWVSYYNTSNTSNVEDRANSIAVDVLGNVYVTGKSVFSGNYYDIITVKYNSLGIEQWVVRYNGPENYSDEGRSIKVDGNGNVYVFGVRDDYGGSVPYNKVVLIKYNSSGQEQWIVEQFGLLSKFEKYDNLAIEESGNVFFTCQRGFPYDYSTFKYNTSGVQQWVSFYSGLEYSDPRSIVVDLNGNVYVTGITRGASSPIPSEYATVKYNSSGIEQWDARYNGPGNFDDEATSIAFFDGVDNVYVTGTSSSVTSNHDFATIKYSQTPALTGTLNIPGDYPDLAMAILDLNKNGVGTGGVTLNLISGNPQTSPAGGYIIGGDGSSVLSTTSATNPITIQGNGNTLTAYTPQPTGLLTDAIFKLIGADYVTITGFTLIENTLNTIDNPGTNDMTEWGIALVHVSTSDGCQNNSITNNSISLKRTYKNTFGIYSNNRHSATNVTTANDVTNNTTGPNSFNKVYSNYISDVNIGTVFIGSGAPTAINAMDQGNDIGGNSSSAGNVYTNCGGLGITPSGYLSLTTNNYCVFMNNQYNDNVSYNSITVAEGTVNSPFSIGGILKDYSGGSSVQPSGNVFSTYNNNTVNITNQTSGVSTIVGIYSKGLNPALSSAKIAIKNNLITDCEATGSPTSGTNFYGIANESSCGIINIAGNTVRGFITDCYSGNIIGIYNNANITDSIILKKNKLGDTISGFVTLLRVSSSAVSGVYNYSNLINSAALLTMTENDIRGINHVITGLSYHSYFVNSSFSGSANISNNTFTNLDVNTNGSVVFLIDGQSFRTNGTSHIVNNNSIVNGFRKSAEGGQVNFLSSAGGNSSTVTETCNSNNFSDIEVTGSTQIKGLHLNDFGSIKTITNNVFRNIKCGYGGITYIIDVSDGDYGAPAHTISGNSIINISSAGGNVVGIHSYDANQNIFKNIIDSLTGKSVKGIQLVYGNVHNVYGNKINYLKGSAVSGINIEIAGSEYNIYNNLIGNILAVKDSVTGYGSSCGIQIDSGETVNLYYNTIYMSPISEDSLTSTGINIKSTTADLTMNNNLIEVQNSGNGKVIAYQNSSPYNFSLSSNNNLFYAGDPSPDNLIFSDGSAINFQTLNDYKIFIIPRDSASVTEEPVFMSIVSTDADYLHVDSTITTQIESGGGIIPGINIDYDLQPRYPNSGYPDNIVFPADNPDIGADEFGGTPPDHTGPVLNFSALSDSCQHNYRYLNGVSITDPSGVAAGTFKPRVYWKINSSGIWSSDSSSSFASPFNFTIGTSGLNSGDSVYYFVVAQDIYNNVSAKPAEGVTAMDVNNILTFPDNPNYYVLNCWLSEVNFEWEREYTYNPGDNKAKYVEVDLMGNSIVTGTIVANNRDIATLKYSPTGTLLWSRIYNNSNVYLPDEDVNDLAVDNQGNIYITGYTANAGGTPNKNILTIKYNPSGDSLWVKQYASAGSGNDEGKAIAVDDSGNVFVTGYTAGSDDDFVTIKYNSAGNQVWVKTYNNSDKANDIDVDDKGNIYVIGSIQANYLTIKYNSSGDQLWYKIHYPTGGGSGAIGKMVEADKQGNVYVTGTSRGTSTGDDFVTIKYDSLGNELWLNRYNRNGNNSDDAIALKITYPSGGGLQSNVIVTGNSSYDFVTLKLNGNNGNIIWQNTYNGPSNSIDKVIALDVDALGNAYVTANSYDNSTNEDFVTIKYSENDGAELWNLRFNKFGTTADIPNDIALGTDGSIFVTGLYNYFGNKMQTVKYKQPVPPAPLPHTLKLTALIESFYNQILNKMIGDTANVFIRNNTSPYAVVDSAISVLDSNGKGTFVFPNAINDTPYYIVVKHRNSIETWSKTGQNFSSGTLTYDFTTSASKAYGDNLVLKGSRYCIYSGDCNNDGFLDGSDLSIIDNDATSFATGYLISDLNGDGVTDGSDAIIAENNSAGFVSARSPLNK